MKNIYALLLFSSTLTIIQNSIAQTHVATFTKYVKPSPASISQTFAAASTTGNLIVVHLSYDNQLRSINNVIDTKGNTYTRINGPTNWDINSRSELWYAYNITGGGAPIKITATLSGIPSSYLQIYISEYSGITISNPLDQNSSASGNTAAVSSGTVTTSMTNELIYGASIGASGLLTVGATFTARSTANQNIIEDKKAAPVGSYSATFNSAGGNWVADLATFKTLTSLPIELISFAAKAIDERTVKLDWATSTETNNDYFEVQRSHDGIDWAVVEKIKGAGNSNSPIHYSITDKTPYPGSSYYRLKQVDFDGQSKSSEVKEVNIDSRLVKPIKIYPNPVDKYLTIEGDYAELQSISVISSLGQLMNAKIQVIRENDFKIVLNLSSLPGGVYFLKTKNKTTPFYKQ